MDTVGAATWSHSINSLRPGGTLVICGTTSGAEPDRAELTKIFFKPLRVRVPPWAPGPSWWPWSGCW